jgi:hypothetical protein
MHPMEAPIKSAAYSLFILTEPGQQQLIHIPLKTKGIEITE